MTPADYTEREGGWLPIESAPKDGSRVKLLIPYNRQMFTEAECTDEGYWDANETSEGLLVFDEIKVGCWRFDGDDGPFDIPPTHWMPITPTSEQIP